MVSSSKLVDFFPVSVYLPIHDVLHEVQSCVVVRDYNYIFRVGYDPTLSSHLCSRLCRNHKGQQYIMPLHLLWVLTIILTTCTYARILETSITNMSDHFVLAIHPHPTDFSRVIFVFNFRGNSPAAQATVDAKTPPHPGAVNSLVHASIAGAPGFSQVRTPQMNWQAL